MDSASSHRHANAHGHIYGLDVLRAFAITGVTLFHMFPRLLPGGYLGVSLFFVLSGYLLAKSCEQKRQHGNFKILDYYKKRILRIYPGLLIMLFVTTGVFFFLEKQAVAGIRPELKSIILGYNNWWQIEQNADYFTKITNASPFTPMWYLAIEIQFYLVWPLVFALYVWLSRLIDTYAGLFFVFALTAVSAVLCTVMYSSGYPITRVYYGTDTRIYGLLFGTLLGLMDARNMLPLLPKKAGRTIAMPLFWVIIAVTCIAYYLMDGQYAFTYLWGMHAMTFIFGVLVVLVGDTRLPVEKWLKIRPLVWLGKNSYEIYLWQYPVLFLFMYRKWNSIPFASGLKILLILVLSAWLHLLTDIIVEFKLPKSVKRAGFASRAGVVSFAMCTVVLFLAGVVGAASAPAEKFAQRDELAKRLEENQRLLQESQGGSSGAAEQDAGADASGTSGQDAGADAAGGTDAETGAGADAGTAGGLQVTYADPTLDNAAQVSEEGVLMIGDSIMLDASPEIKKQLPDCYIDAVESRMPGACVELARELIDAGHLNQSVVISLGTNGAITKDIACQILDEFGPDISVFWINLFGRTVMWEEESNQLLFELEDEYPNLSVIDWNGLIREHPEWLWEDGEHPNIEGSAIFAQMIRESLDVVKQKHESSGEAPAAETSASYA